MKKIQEDKKALENAIKKVDDIHDRLKIQMEKIQEEKKALENKIQGRVIYDGQGGQIEKIHKEIKALKRKRNGSHDLTNAS